MNELLKAYLMHNCHYLQDGDVRIHDTIIKECEPVYVVRVENEATYKGYELVEVSVSDLLVFLFERNA